MKQNSSFHCTYINKESIDYQWIEKDQLSKIEVQSANFATLETHIDKLGSLQAIPSKGQEGSCPSNYTLAIAHTDVLTYT